MKMPTTKFLKYWIPVLIYATFIFISSSMPPSPVLEKIKIPFFDKILHTFSYSILGYLLLRALFNYGYSLSRGRLILVAILIGTLYGISDEIHQFFVLERTSEIMDIVFDSFGSALGVFIYNHGRY